MEKIENQRGKIAYISGIGNMINPTWLDNTLELGSKFGLESNDEFSSMKNICKEVI